MSTMTFRNSQEAFIHKHVSLKLTEKGFETLDVKRAANFAVDTYRNTASFGGSRGGKCFDFCLAKAEQLLSPIKKQAAKNKRKAKAA
ncbi:hypothetical protein SBW85_03065 [Vibrio plantisponsor]|uniref:Uncharacterized protein n=1 Tax=Vibrio plantisponsor TaxID=664643 RepID=A0ABU4IEM4_9VIBR|nr:hypothetical protein [Vibrio plantisponsor]MDW6016748.1 hypothetical protein [Vibrio plantisponsor]NNM39881.1 hypothetical protein [Vibrio plantisponsor]